MTAKKKTTARTTGLTGNQFASVEQGRSYVLSVHSPSGAGEIELLAADSDQQREPDMFSMLYEKIETARQIPFIAISPFVFVNVWSSDVQWVVIPANFSLAVPGASSGGGSSFDPASDQDITGNWTFEKPLGVATPLLSTQATNKQYVDEALEKYAKLDADQTFQGMKNFDDLVSFNSELRINGSTSVAGVMTFSKTPNANAGINIPLTVGAPTDTGAVNRFYTSGLAGAVSALVQPIYLNSSSITVAGSISKSSNGTLAGLTQRFSVGAASAGSNAYGSAVIPLIGPNGQFNYSSVCGFSLALNATAFAKFTFGIGRGSKTNRTGLTMDSYSMIPGNNLAVNYGEIIDVTINTPYDTVRKGYEIRVREIFYVKSVGHWQVKTTTVFLPVGHNELMPNGLNRLIFMQSGPPSIEEREEKAALYMELGGGSTNTLFKIASLRGFINFEAGTGVSTLIIDARNEKTYALSADAGTGTRHLYANGLTNPTYHALEAMAVNAIESEETAAFEDINIPLEQA